MAEVVKKYFTLQNRIVWAKNSWTRGDLKGNYGNQDEEILFAHKGRRYLEGKRSGTILIFDKVPSHLMRHPTEKSVKLLEHLISKSTLEGEVVLDPFMGSGSTCVAAQNPGRRYIGIELEPVWFEVAKERLAAKK